VTIEVERDPIRSDDDAVVGAVGEVGFEVVIVSPQRTGWAVALSGVRTATTTIANARIRRPAPLSLALSPPS
jgi:hypothetical protein